jgi:TFIIF-interacting CTD phosphatase-like protein
LRAWRRSVCRPHGRSRSASRTDALRRMRASSEQTGQFSQSSMHLSLDLAQQVGDNSRSSSFLGKKLLHKLPAHTLIECKYVGQWSHESSCGYRRYRCERRSRPFRLGTVRVSSKKESQQSSCKALFPSEYRWVAQSQDVAE